MRGNGFKVEEVGLRLDIRKSGKVLEQGAQRGYESFKPRSVEKEVGWNYEQPGLVGTVLAHLQGVGTSCSLSGPFQPTL